MSQEHPSSENNLSEGGEPENSNNQLPTARNGNVGRRMWFAVTFLALLALAAFGYWTLFMHGIVSSDDARLDADRVDLTPDLPGRLDKLYVDKGDWVQKGRPVFALDQSLLEVALNQAKVNVETARASLAVTQAQLSKVLHGSRYEEIQMALDVEKQTGAQAELSKTEYERMKSLYEQGAGTKAQLDKTQAALTVAENAHLAASHRLALLRRGARREDLEMAKAKVDVATAHLRASQVAVEKAQTDLEHSVVHAPFSGNVVRVWRLPGTTIAPGTPVVTLENPATLHVAANIDEKELNKISIGDSVNISIDAFPEHQLHGKVKRILRATNSTFSLIPAEGVSGTFIKVAQRVPIIIDFDSMPKLPLGMGLSVVVDIHVSGKEGQGNANAENVPDREKGVPDKVVSLPESSGAADATPEQRRP